MLQARSFTTVALALLCAVALLPARRAAAQRVFGDPEFLRDAAALGLQREGPVPDYENLTATAQLARAGAEPDAAARGAQATAAAGGPLAEAPGASAPNACQVELEWSATSEATYSGRLYTSSIGFWLRFGSKNTRTALRGHTLAEMQREGGCVRSAYQVVLFGETLQESYISEPLVSAQPDPWANPDLVGALESGVSLVAPAGGAPSWELDRWTASSGLGRYTFTYTAEGVKGVITTPSSTPVTPGKPTGPIAADVKITAGKVTVHFAGVWGGYPDEGDMIMDLAGTTGAATGCTLLAYTDYQDPPPNTDPATSETAPYLLVAPPRKLKLDCSKMQVQLSEVQFEYEDAQCKTCQPNCCPGGRPPSPIPTYDGKLQLLITSLGTNVAAEGEFQNAEPAAS